MQYTHKRIYEVIVKAQNPVFVSDERIDGDSLGSSLALYNHFAKLGRKIPVYVAEEIPSKYKFLPGVNECTTDKTIFENPLLDVVVVFDCSDANFVQSLLEKSVTKPLIINIDHHKTNSLYGDINQVIVESPAASEVVYQLFKANNILPCKDSATCLLTGICFDTTIFSNSGTNENAFDAASQLTLYGARVSDIIQFMYANRTVNALRLWGIALERLHFSDENNHLTTCLTRKDIDEHFATDEDVDGLSNFLNLVSNEDILIVMRETLDGGVKVSMRSNSVDVSEIARLNGGGGHSKASGYSVVRARLVEGSDGKWGVVRVE